MFVIVRSFHDVASSGFSMITMIFHSDSFMFIILHNISTFSLFLVTFQKVSTCTGVFIIFTSFHYLFIICNHFDDFGSLA